jgi:ferredoxin-NADP reductase
MTLAQTDRLELRILSIISESPSVRTFVLEKPLSWHWVEGSHARFGVVIGDTLDQRTMSVSSLPGDGVITITTRRYASVSPYKAALWEKQVGDTLWVSIPRSRFTLPREDRPVLLLAMGVGMATLLPLVRAHQNDATHITSLMVITVDREINLFKTIDRLSIVHVHTLNRLSFHKALDQALSRSKPIVMVVGSDRLVESVVRTLKAQGLSQLDLRLDKKEAAIERIWAQNKAF